MLNALRLQNFRCFSQLAVELETSRAMFIGDNAQGKTSILEAVCVLMRLGSPRAKRMQPMVEFDTEGFGIGGDYGDDSLQVRFSKGKLTTSFDGELIATQSEYLQGSGLVVWMGNEDVELVRGSGGVRRHYLDFLCSQINPAYRTALSRYRKVLKSRNLLLKDGAKRDQEINAYGELLIEYGDLLDSVRRQAVAEILPQASVAQAAISGSEKKESLGLEYISGSGGDMRSALESSYESERRQRQTVVGPHRDDVKITINGMPAADYSSEGQQRTVALALKLAQGDVLQALGDKLPVYLLDDIFGELDAKRRNALMHYLPENAQILITTTSVDWLEKEEADEWKQFQVKDAGVEIIS